jgi:hypothetical protein
LSTVQGEVERCIELIDNDPYGDDVELTVLTETVQRAHELGFGSDDVTRLEKECESIGRCVPGVRGFPLYP